jgi:hypothetical protein
MFAWQRIRIWIGLAAVVACGSFAAIIDAQPPRVPNPPAAKRPGSPQSRPAPAQPITNGPQVQLVSPTSDVDTPPGTGNQIRIATPADDPFPAPNPQAPRPAGDPTIPSPEVRQMLEAGNVNRATPNQPAASPSLPPMSIKARIISRDRPPVAVIDIGGTTITVRPGVEFNIGSGGGGPPLHLKVKEMTQSEVRFEVEGRRQIITLN